MPIDEKFLETFDGWEPARRDKFLAKINDETTRFAVNDAYKNWKQNQPGKFEALFRGGSRGALANFSDEIAGAAGAATEAVYNKFFAPDIQKAGGGQARPETNLRQSYLENKQDWNDRDAQAEHEHKGYYKGGEVGGAIASALIPGASIGKGLSGAVKTGIAYGGANALGKSEADLTSGKAEDYEKAALDTTEGGVLGGIFGAGGYGLAKAGGYLSDKAAIMAFKATHPKLNDLRTISEDEMIDIGRRLIKEKVLGEKVFGIPIPGVGRTTKGITKALEPIKQEAAGDIDQVVGQLDQAAEMQGKQLDPDEIALQLYSNASDRYTTSAMQPTKEMVENQAVRFSDKYQDEPLTFEGLRNEKSDYQSLGKYDQATPNNTSDAYRNFGYDLRTIMEEKAGEVSPPLQQKLLDANKRYAELAPAEKMAADNALREAAKRFGIPALDLVAGMYELNRGGDPAKAAAAGLLMHAILTRGKSSGALGLNALSKVFGIIPAKLGDKLPNIFSAVEAQ